MKAFRLLVIMVMAFGLALSANGQNKVKKVVPTQKKVVKTTAASKATLLPKTNKVTKADDVRMLSPQQHINVVGPESVPGGIQTVRPQQIVDSQVAAENEDSVYMMPQKLASFPGGERGMVQFISSHLQYPPVCQEAGIQGRVMVRFVVNIDGSISDVVPLQSPHEELTKEAVRVVMMMPRWRPAVHDGHVVRCAFTLPITFRLPSDGK